MKVLIVDGRPNQQNNQKSNLEKMLVHSLEAYDKDYKQAGERVKILDRESAKRNQQRIVDYQKLSLFGKA